ncbi:MAG: hypothetical protein IT372_07440 [Polyangiaceae bacterium]|nr:hypothetical protein [Polyangiaceae bacterium]
MNTDPSQSLSIDPVQTALPVSPHLGEAPPAEVVETPAMRAESAQRAGKRMILAGFVIIVIGVVLYCAACFAGGMDADMGDALFRNAAPFARATLCVLGLGTVVWLVGSYRYLQGVMDADDRAGDTE